MSRPAELVFGLDGTISNPLVGIANSIHFALRRIADALEGLADRGISLGVCSAKGGDFAGKILEMFGIRSYFASVGGGDSGVRKVQQLAVLLERGRIGASATMSGIVASTFWRRG